MSVQSRSESVMRAVCTGVLAAALGACASDPEQGYTFQSPFRSDVQSVAVPIFENTTFNYGLEMELTEAVVKEIQRITPWRVAPRESADTTLTGTITQAELRKISTEPTTGFAQELAVEITVSFEWKDNATGRVLVSKRNFRAADLFAPVRGVQEPIEFGQAATTDELAKAIVAEMRSSW